MPLNKIPADMASAEFNKFAEAMDIDTDVENMDEEDKKDFEGIRRKIESIMSGRLVVNDNGEPEYTPEGAENALVFQEPTGASLMASDKRKKTENVARLNTVMGEMCGVPSKTSAMLQMRDFKVCSAITTLFLA